VHKIFHMPHPKDGSGNSFGWEGCWLGDDVIMEDSLHICVAA
jgi:hypothetical protein